MKNQNSIMIMYAVSPCHAGSGSSLGTIDNPIQRERHTNWPVIQSSGMKGALRANFDRYKSRATDSEQVDNLTVIVFGDENAQHAGAISISDAKILAYPMRSNVSPFVWISCPAVLKRLSRDLHILKPNNEILSFDGLEKFFRQNNNSEVGLIVQGIEPQKVLLEDMEVEAKKDELVKKTIESLLDDYLKSAERLVIVSDTVFNYGVEQCTQVVAQIRIDPKTGTTQTGSLRYQEELPADTILYTLIGWGDSREGEAKYPNGTIKRWVQNEVIKTHIQVGGDDTMGRGIFEITWKE